jgi:hypothetical protein
MTGRWSVIFCYDAGFVHRRLLPRQKKLLAGSIYGGVAKKLLNFVTHRREFSAMTYLPTASTHAIPDIGSAHKAWKSWWKPMI